MAGADPVALRGAVHPGVHVVDGGVGGGRGRRGAAGLDDRRAALGDGRDEGARSATRRSTCSATGLPPTWAWNRSGYWLAEWLPQIVMPAHLRDRDAELRGDLRQRAVVVEPHHRAEPVGRDVGRVRAGDQRVGVGRVADHQHADVVRGAGVDRLALRLEDAAVGLEQVGRAPSPVRADGRRPAGRPRRRRRPRLASSVMSMPASSGKAQSSSSIAVPSAALSAGVISSRLSRTGVSGPSMCAGGDPEQQRVADLAGCSGDRHRDGGLAHRRISS